MDARRSQLGRLSLALKLRLVFAVLGTGAATAIVTGAGALDGGAAKLVLLVAGGVGVVVAALSAWLLVRELTRGVGLLGARLDAFAGGTEERLLGALNALAAGDLSVEVAAKTAAASEFGHDEFGYLMRTAERFRDAVFGCYIAYNRAVATLREMVGEVRSTAASVDDTASAIASTSEETGRATGEIAHAVGDVARGAERQVRIVDVAQRSAEEVAQAMARSADIAGETATAAEDARAVARAGVKAAEDANDAMLSVRSSSQAVTEAISGLADKSAQIGTFVQTISGIAEQTNLLALNAAIEAARAGEQGRGFAVVAEEVRKLAEGSQDAAAEISQLIAAIQEQTNRAVRVVQDGSERTEAGAAVVEQARKAFLQIGSSVDDIAGRIEQIASSAEQIAASAGTMQQSIGEVAAVAEESSASAEQVSASTEQTSASVQQIAASAAQLATSANSLHHLVARFRMGTMTD
jgi:methyl-accepting chemotaxis protein